MQTKGSGLEIAIIGAGGFAREVHDIVSDNLPSTHRIKGFYVDDIQDVEISEITGLPIRPLTDLLTQDIKYFIAIGDGAVRQRLDVALSLRADLGSLKHSSATFGYGNSIGEGSIFAAGSRLTTNIQTGRHFHLNLNSTVGHDSIIGDYVTVFPGVNISGNVVIGDKTTIGTGSSILPGIRIGAGCFIGAGAVVTKDVEDGQTVVGVPARPMTK